MNTKIGEIENKIPHRRGLRTTNVLNTKISEAENKIPDSSKYVTITTEGFNKLTAEHFAARLKHADLVNRTDFNNKLTSCNRRITSHKTKTFRSSKGTK